MTRRHWTITTHLTGRPRDVDVFLYDQLSHMRGAATKYSKRVDDEPETFPRAAAVTHGFHLYLVNDDGTETEQQRAAIIRFARARITPEIVSHEVTHAAQHLYGLDCIPEDDKAKDHFDAANEKFAYLLGDLFATVWSLVNESAEFSPRSVTLANQLRAKALKNLGR